jgi:hypothetical protein
VQCTRPALYPQLHATRVTWLQEQAQGQNFAKALARWALQSPAASRALELNEAHAPDVVSIEPGQLNKQSLPLIVLVPSELVHKAAEVRGRSHVQVSHDACTACSSHVKFEIESV